jgi:drug/metabolite transporter (DMT)-like permease
LIQERRPIVNLPFYLEVVSRSRIKFKSPVSRPDIASRLVEIMEFNKRFADQKDFQTHLQITGHLLKSCDVQSKDNSKAPRKGYLYVVLAAIFWAASGSAAKFLFNSGITAFQLAQSRITLSAASIFVWLLIRNPRLLKVSRRDIFYFLVLGTFGMAAVNFTYLYAISKIQVAAAILLQYLAPVFIALYSAIFLREKLSGATLAALIGALLGCYLVVGAYNLNILALNSAGILGGLGAALSFAWWSVHGEYGMRRYSPWTVLFYAMFFAAIEWNLIHPPLEAFTHSYAPVVWGWILYIGIIGTILPFGFYYEGINLIRSTRASITATLEPITAGLIAYIFLGEIMEPLQLLGAALVIAAVVFLQLKQEYDDKAPGLIRAKLKGQNPT